MLKNVYKKKNTMLLCLLFFLPIKMTLANMVKDDLLTQITIRLSDHVDTYETYFSQLKNEKYKIEYIFLNKLNNSIADSIIIEQLINQPYIHINFDEKKYYPSKSITNLGLFLHGKVFAVTKDYIILNTKLLINNSDIIDSQSDGTYFLFRIGNIDGKLISYHNRVFLNQNNLIFEDNFIKIYVKIYLISIK